MNKINCLLVLTSLLIATNSKSCCSSKEKRRSLLEEIIQIPVDMERILHLINSKADVHSQDDDGLTPIMHAVKQENMQLIEALRNAGAFLHNLTQHKND